MKIKNKLKIRNIGTSIEGSFVVHLIEDENSSLSETELNSLFFCREQEFFVTLGLSEAPKPKEMTIKQICKELGREIKIVKE